MNTSKKFDLDKYGIAIPIPNIKIGANYKEMKDFYQSDDFDYEIYKWSGSSWNYFTGCHQTPPRTYHLEIRIKDNLVDGFMVTIN